MKFPPDHNCNFVLLQFPTFGCTREVKNLRGRVQQIRSSDYQHRWRELGIRTRGCRLVEPLSDLWLLVKFSQFIDIFVVFCDTLLHLTLNLRHLTQFCIKFVVVIFIELVVHGIRTRGRRLVDAGGQPIYFLIRVSTLLWNKANDWMKPAVWWVLPNQCDNLSSKKSS